MKDKSEKQQDSKNGTVSGRKAARQIPGYQIISKLGSGSMAVVFKARQLSLNRFVAIKILPKKLSEDPEYVERFYSEGMAAAKLNHPNIVGALDVGVHDGYHYFIMEYVEGKTVDEVISEKSRYSDSEALHIVLQVARALKHAHDQGLIHRDVKPKNIMITPDGIVKLMDLGLARAADDMDAIKSESGRLFGTPYYISPEQIVGDQDVDYRCDIYSLGATLYHMVTGQVPFDGEDGKEVMKKHVKQRPVSPDRINMDISFGLCKTILLMMAKKKEDRYPSTEALIEDLESIDFLLEVDDGRPPQIPVVEPKPVPKPVKETKPEPKEVKKDTTDDNKGRKQKNQPPEPIVVDKRKITIKNLKIALGVSILINLILIILLIYS